jgi:hypothetical protein
MEFHNAQPANGSVSAGPSRVQSLQTLNSQQPFPTGLGVRFTVEFSTVRRYASGASGFRGRQVGSRERPRHFVGMAHRLALIAVLGFIGLVSHGHRGHVHHAKPTPPFNLAMR